LSTGEARIKTIYISLVGVASATKIILERKIRLINLIKFMYSIDFT